MRRHQVLVNSHKTIETLRKQTKSRFIINDQQQSSRLFEIVKLREKIDALLVFLPVLWLRCACFHFLLVDGDVWGARMWLLPLQVGYLLNELSVVIGNLWERFYFCLEVFKFVNDSFFALFPLFRDQLYDFWLRVFYLTIHLFQLQLLLSLLNRTIITLLCLFNNFLDLLLNFYTLYGIRRFNRV